MPKKPKKDDRAAKLADKYVAEQKLRLDKTAKKPRLPPPPKADAFDVEALRPLIIDLNGDVAAIAKAFDADSEHLRNFIMNTPPLRRALDEVIARGVDQSLTVLFQGLDDGHFTNRLASAKEFLKSRAAQRRGFHHAADLELKMPAKGGALTLTWLPPEEQKNLPSLIEGKVEDQD